MKGTVNSKLIKQVSFDLSSLNQFKIFKPVSMFWFKGARFLLRGCRLVSES